MCNKIICITLFFAVFMELALCQAPDQMAQAGVDKMTSAMNSVPVPGAQQAAGAMQTGFDMIKKFAKEGQQTAEKALEMGMKQMNQ